MGGKNSKKVIVRQSNIIKLGKGKPAIRFATVKRINIKHKKK